MRDLVDIEPVAIIADQIGGILQSMVAFIPQGLAALLVLLVTWIAAKLVGILFAKFPFRSRVRPSLVEVLRTLVTIAVWMLGLLIAAVLAMPNLTPTKVLAGLGLGSLAIGLAFKDIFENFIAGLMILLRDPMRLGDYIECEGIEGRVQKITIRDSYIRRTDGQLVMVPNAMLFKNPVFVKTDLEERRMTLICGVAYGENVDAAREVITQAVQSVDAVSDTLPIQVFAREFNSSSIDFEITWWTGSRPIDERVSRDKVIAAVKHALDAAGIEIPFPYRTLTFKEDLRIRADAPASGGNPEAPPSVESS
ncbi:mechanosensitive ion channel family protein [Imhoffiella purpurea]|uniref:Small-conductance mechanosensitive channel n=1 Tax=Imhoffiella purpurea TaxID=1249627 RepID=W9VA62_9GAMM|nr:mechanosensitive ion channel family protein [Imhoffiella purpurea]EXJ16309.1 Potassium efflux system KefA protein [Imhoffiella purpurea]